MGDFKPLMKIGGIELIRLTVTSMVAGGINDIFVVTGRESARVKEVLLRDDPQASGSVVPGSPLPVIHFVENRDYQTTDMLFSIQRGLQALCTYGSVTTEDRKDILAEPIAATFVIPGDVAGVCPKTVAALREHALLSKASIICPTYHFKRGHPILIKEECFSSICDYQGEGGLKQALEAFSIELVNVDDEGILLDVDYPHEFEYLSAYLQPPT